MVLLRYFVQKTMWYSRRCVTYIINVLLLFSILSEYIAFFPIPRLLFPKSPPPFTQKPACFLKLQADF